MSYDPIVWRRKRKASQWAALITGKPESSLEHQARNYISAQQSITPPASLSDQATFTILIGFHSHLEHFSDCITSVADAHKTLPESCIQLIVINDDPRVHSSKLEEIIASTPLNALIRSNKANLGICRSFNETLPHVQGEWILLLDCDDRLRENCLLTLHRTIKKHPGIRFISSRCVDIDAAGQVLAYRLRDESPVDLIRNNFASHLKAIRKDLFDDIGIFDGQFEGCQDFEFALRTSLFEQILFIPEYLYEYRWHDTTQTVGNCNRQNEIIIRTRQTYLLAIEWILHGIRGIGIHFTGPYADTWAKKIPAETGNATIEVEATAPFSSRLHRLLLIQAARNTVIWKSLGENNTPPSLVI